MKMICQNGLIKLCACSWSVSVLTLLNHPRVLLGPTTYTTFTKFLVSNDGQTPTNIGTLDLTFNASLTFVLDYGRFSQNKKLQYEEESGRKKTRNVAIGVTFFRSRGNFTFLSREWFNRDDHFNITLWIEIFEFQHFFTSIRSHAVIFMTTTSTSLCELKYLNFNIFHTLIRSPTVIFMTNHHWWSRWFGALQAINRNLNRYNPAIYYAYHMPYRWGLNHDIKYQSEHTRML